MKLRCLWNHAWERITYWKAIERPKSMNIIEAVPCALFECGRCGDVMVRKVYGQFTWRGTEEVSVERARAEWTYEILSDMGYGNIGYELRKRR